MILVTTTLPVERAARGDQEAFEELVRRFSPGVYHLALNMTRNPQEAEEVLQETFLTAYRRLAELRQPDRFKSWLYRIAANQALMRLRSRRRHPEESLEEGEEKFELRPWTADPAELYQHVELQGALRRGLEQLSPEYRSVFWLRDVEGLSNQEVADLLKLSLPAVKSRLLRARLQLREQLAKEMQDRA